VFLCVFFLALVYQTSRKKSEKDKEEK